MVGGAASSFLHMEAATMSRIPVPIKITSEMRNEAKTWLTMVLASALA
jgi:hypothetical protein